MSPLHAVSPQIPILGQLFTIKGWFATVLVTCHCPAQEPVMIPAGAIVQCGACHRHYTIGGMRVGADGNLQFGVQVAVPESEAQQYNIESGQIETRGDA